MTRFCRLIFSGVLSIVALSFAPPALADCSTPAGVEGDQIYNTTVDVMQFCNGTNWVNMGAAGGAAAETDPQVGTLTNTKWCTSDGTAINCTTDAPSAGGSDVQTFNSSGTWTKPGSGTIAMVECWGGGAGGTRHYSGGGGGGGYNMKWIPLSSLGATETVTIGAGGTGKTGSDGPGTAGGNSTFGSHLTGYGGGVAAWYGPYGQYQGGGGGGPAGAASGTTPGTPLLLAAFFWYSDTNNPLYQGSPNINGPTVSGVWHGGGGGSNTTPGGSLYGGGGGGANNNAGGSSSYGGSGGAGINPGAGVAGTQPGGGGGAGTTSGGNGGAGRCKVTVF